jgi:hypothetical protein
MRGESTAARTKSSSRQIISRLWNPTSASTASSRMARNLIRRRQTVPGLSTPGNLTNASVLLDFLIGARSRALEPPARERLLDYLRDISLPGHPGVLPHPVDVMVARKP